METYGKILLVAMPAFLVLVLFEKWWGWHKGKDTVRTVDMLSSLSSGATNSTRDVLGLSVAIIGYGWMESHLAIFHVQSSVWLYIIAFISLDFAGYLGHRIDHEYNIFWNAHIIHHSSEEFNLACALRQSISTIIRVFTIFLLPAALLGVPATVVAVVAPLHLFAQFWYHTQHISKMGFLEKIIVTPSHHRVHHAINKEYIDKNYGQIFIFWDKWFGTFQEELPGVPAVYGITRQVKTWNPIKINFIHMWQLIKDAWHTKKLKDKFRIWFMPTGWRPEDVKLKFPLEKIEDPYHFTKYDTSGSKFFIGWLWFQMSIVLLAMSYLFGNLAAIGSPGIFVFGGFLFLFIYAMTELMDQHPHSWIWESAKAVMGLIMLFQWGGWYGINQQNTGIAFLISTYLVLSVFVTYVLVNEENKKLVPATG